MKHGAKPNLSEIGTDLLRLTRLQIALALFTPFFFSAAYFVFFAQGQFALALVMLIALSYATYGSASHDLVHGCYRLPRRLNLFLLSAMEMLCLRSGTAYRMVHLKHHQSFPSHEDVEGLAAAFSWHQALLYGVLFQPVVWRYAFLHGGKQRRAFLVEACLILAILVFAIILLPVFPQLLIYCLVLHVGSWIIPIMTSYLPHRAEETTEIDQTRRFRGIVSSILLLEHLYHLEHHMYPSIPHQNWPALAKRLDPYLDEQATPPIKFLW